MTSLESLSRPSVWPRFYLDSGCIITSERLAVRHLLRMISEMAEPHRVRLSGFGEGMGKNDLAKEFLRNHEKYKIFIVLKTLYILIWRLRCAFSVCCRIIFLRVMCGLENSLTFGPWRLPSIYLIYSTFV